MNRAQTVSEAVELMKKYDIEHIPVMNHNGPVGAISESGLFQKIFDNPEIKTQKLNRYLSPPTLLLILTHLWKN